MEFRATTERRPLSHLVTDRRLRLFGHIASSSPQQDHHRAVAAVIRGLPPDWKRPLGRPSHTWLRAVEADLGQQNIGIASAWRKAAIRDDWRRIVDSGVCYERKKKFSDGKRKNGNFRTKQKGWKN